MQQPLNASTLPLHGLALIEASAGTGKTYTIANLYLRLLLGHNATDTHELTAASTQVPALSVEQILVVTFTEAATGELRDRIRVRIRAARQAFMTGNSTDAFIQQLLSDCGQHPQHAQRLLAAERQMDEAAIFTIHGFCGRMLKQHAVASGTLLTSTLITDDTPLLQAGIEDFWRRTVYPLDKPLVALANSLWPGPEHLLHTLRPWLHKPDLTLVTDGLPASLAQFQHRYVQPVQTLKARWRQQLHPIREQLMAGGLKANSKPLTHLAAMEAFIHSDRLVPTLGKAGQDSWALYSTAALAQACKKKAACPDHPVFTRIDALIQQPLSLTAAFRGLILRTALTAITPALQQLKNARHQMAFDDLLAQLAAALCSTQGDTLAAAIQQQFPMALVDEFQDTDPQQYRIFRTIYSHRDVNEEPQASNHRTTGLFLIGDPKQAIYGFRGADIFTYMAARQQISNHYALTTNWRSTRPMINAVNRLFAFSPSPFMYDQAIPFLPVQPAPSADQRQFIDPDACQAALHIWFMDTESEQTVTKGAYETTLATATALEINRLLTQADQGHCRLQAPTGQRPLQAQDIAVLVRTGRQAHSIKHALTNQGIASVYLSNNDSVFASQEAMDIQRLLTACLQPTDGNAVRAALATPALGLSAAALDNFNHDEHAWAQMVATFQTYQQLWLQQGVLPMLRTLLHQQALPEKLLACPSGERQLTNILHIGELLAVAAQALSSPQALLRWLTEQIAQPNHQAADQQLHLESEQCRVKIITIHKAKGLEYPVVFLPFASSGRAAQTPLYHNDHHQAVLDLVNQASALEQADRERLAEDVRLLYVALTRAVYRCYLGLAPVRASGKGPHNTLATTALGRLLTGHGPQANTPSALRAALPALTNGHDVLAVTAPPCAPRPAYQPPVTATPDVTARTFTGTLKKRGWVTSYSALVPHATTRMPTNAPANANNAEGDDQHGTDPISNDYSLFHFPRGAQAGTLLHTLLEQAFTVIDRQDNQSAFTAWIQAQLQLAGYADQWCPALTTLVDRCLHTPLNDEALQLGQLSAHQRRMEMAFYLPIAPSPILAFNQLAATHDPISAQAGPLPAQSLSGMLKGFIDLVFMYQDRWYVLDYKSNWLGNRPNDYRQANMTQAMVEHRYDLQYQLYSLALHRQLKHRRPDYDYDRHFGGVFYLFLRGLGQAANQRYGVFQHRPAKALIAGLDALFTGQASPSG